jgi:hypothetical protein
MKVWVLFAGRNCCDKSPPNARCRNCLASREFNSLADESGLGVKCPGSNTFANGFRTWRDPRKPSSDDRANVAGRSFVEHQQPAKVATRYVCMWLDALSGAIRDKVFADKFKVRD